MPPKRGIEIESVLTNSPAKKAGLRAGDVLLSINSHPLNDAIDYMFHKSTEALNIEFLRNKTRSVLQIDNGNHDDLGLTVKSFRVKTCRNNCVFCFVKQLPRGLRKSLYVKDEDYRMSFLYGNYMTLTNLDSREKQRIVDQRLSPLYISVHTTNRSLRNKMLGNSHATDIMKELKYFAGRKIRMHTQIVLCPGYNDRQELKKTIRDLYKFYPYVASIAVVPVGLTAHRKVQIAPVTGEDAAKTIEIVSSFQRRFQKKHGDSIVYCSDEMYLKAGFPMPKLKDYGNFPQIENGVGMVPLFISYSRKVKIPKPISGKKKFLAFTGVSFYPFLKKFAARLAEKENIRLDVIPVENRFFGPSITVTGLLTGRDVIKSLKDNTDSYDCIVVPGVALREDADIFLDNVTLKDLEDALGNRTVRCEPTPQGLIDAIAAV